MEDMCKTSCTDTSLARIKSRCPLDDFQLRALFDQFDTDGSGTIGVDEFAHAVVSIDIDISDTEARRLFSWVDHDAMEGAMDFGSFKYALLHNSFFRMVANDLSHGVTEAALDYDYSVPSYLANKHQSYAVENKWGTGGTKDWDLQKHGDLFGKYTEARKR